jgi:hypothetical protein
MLKANIQTKGEDLMEQKRKRASYSLETDYQDLFEEIAKKRRMTMTALLRIWIDREAYELGMTPLAPINPKFTASILKQARVVS